MTVYLVHHGPAVDSVVDPMRPLTQAGRERMVRAAAAAAAAAVKPAAIWHSGKLRARQTAEIFLSSCNPLARMTAARGLLPDDPPGWIADQLLVEAADIMIVGHQPNLGKLWRTLDPGSGDALFPPHGIVAVQRAEEGWRTVWQRES